jgi:HEAT repeat protein
MRALIITGIIATVGVAAPARAQQPPAAGLAESARAMADSAKAMSESLRGMRLDLLRDLPDRIHLDLMSDSLRAMQLDRLDFDFDFAMADQGRRHAAEDRAREREDEARQRETEAKERERERENDRYERGQDALDNQQWERAVRSFDEVISLKLSKADAAMYWKAYAQNRLGQRPEALTTIAELTKAYPNSRYLKQAKALEVEVRQNSGRPVSPANETDEELKLLAINGLMNTDPETAIPMLQKTLDANNSPRVKERALFVLAQSSSPKAREVLVSIAKGGSTPDLQSKAIQYLGIHGGRESRAALAEVYASSSDVDIKRRILRAFMVAGEKDRLFTAAQSEPNAELRAEAVRQLGVMGARAELWTMYQKESSADVKKQILQAMFVGGDSDHMIELAKAEKDPALRRVAVRNLGLMGSKRNGDALVEIYAQDKDPQVRRAVIDALFLQNNADQLVAIGRKEEDPAMRKEIVQKLSIMPKSKAVTDFLLEILNK